MFVKHFSHILDLLISTCTYRHLIISKNTIQWYKTLILYMFSGLFLKKTAREILVEAQAIPNQSFWFLWSYLTLLNHLLSLLSKVSTLPVCCAIMKLFLLLDSKLYEFNFILSRFLIDFFIIIGLTILKIFQMF